MIPITGLTVLIHGAIILWRKSRRSSRVILAGAFFCLGLVKFIYR